ncbi:MAG: CorA family divalent cation transporter [Anaerovoracaceae bacterium]
MNFPNMPELHWRYGYAVVIGLSALTVTLEILYFKKKKML